MTLQALEVAGYLIAVVLGTVGVYCAGGWFYDRFLDSWPPDDAVGVTVVPHRGEQGSRAGCRAAPARMSRRSARGPIL